MPEWLAAVITVSVMLAVFGGVIALCVWTVPWLVERLFPRDHPLYPYRATLEDPTATHIREGDPK